jgi:shikimate kinase
MNIVLIGYRGTGKTVVGKVLAKRLGRPFVDADVHIEVKAGRTISDMVAAEGWPFFRAREKEAIHEISEMDNSVIAPGGGAVMDEENVAYLSNKGWFVLLKADIDTMIQRIQGDQTSAQQRPKLLDDKDDIYRETKAVIEQRMPTYETVADFAIDTTNLTVEEVVEKILKEFRDSGN